MAHAFIHFIQRVFLLNQGVYLNLVKVSPDFPNIFVQFKVKKIKYFKYFYLLELSQVNFLIIFFNVVIQRKTKSLKSFKY